MANIHFAFLSVPQLHLDMYHSLELEGKTIELGRMVPPQLQKAQIELVGWQKLIAITSS